MRLLGVAVWALLTLGSLGCAAGAHARSGKAERTGTSRLTLERLNFQQDADTLRRMVATLPTQAQDLDAPVHSKVAVTDVSCEAERCELWFRSNLMVEATFDRTAGMLLAIHPIDHADTEAVSSGLLTLLDPDASLRASHARGDASPRERFVPSTFTFFYGEVGAMSVNQPGVRPPAEVKRIPVLLLGAGGGRLYGLAPGVMGGWELPILMGTHLLIAPAGRITLHSWNPRQSRRAPGAVHLSMTLGPALLANFAQQLPGYRATLSLNVFVHPVASVRLSLASMQTELQPTLDNWGLTLGLEN